MTRRSAIRWLAVILLLIGAVLAWRVIAWRPLDVPATGLPDRFVRVSGVAHIHTTASDGGGTLDEIEEAAATTGLDFIIVTDHNSMAGKPREGYGASGILTIVGTEVSNHEGHLLATGLPAPAYRFSGDGLDALRDLDDLGGLAFAAHPESPRDELRWTGWALPGSWGLEVLNGDSQWRAAGWARLFRSALLYPLNTDYALLRLVQRSPALDRWDELLTRRHAPAIAGADAHGTLRPGPSSSLPLPTYEAVFRVAQNYILLERPLTDLSAEPSAPPFSRRSVAAEPTSALAPSRTRAGSSTSPNVTAHSGRWERRSRWALRSGCAREARFHQASD